MSELVVFELAGQRLGLASEHVHELVRAVQITRLAGAPPGIDGVIDLRGTIVPVFDLRARLSLPPRSVQRDEHMLICAAGETTVAIRADRVVEIRAGVELDVLTTRDSVMHALARLPDGLVVICDLSAVLTTDDLDALQRALAEAR
jgi:purine-binding chemotaxis protein CheW